MCLTKSLIQIKTLQQSLVRNSIMKKNQWTVSEAKTHLSEILRKCREEGPQRIGKRNGYVVVSEKEWKREYHCKEIKMGKWLVQNAPNIGEIELPERGQENRQNPFDHQDS